ncbi:MAG: hemolysin III family protein [Planctomycetes bacterium]|nr:hemolysin III family protein [Planctomycetota bacterium]
MQPLAREQSRGEELANSLSHAMGLLAAVVATPFLLSAAARHGGSSLIGACVFVASMLLLYLASTLYHALPVGGAKRALRVVEHSAIFVLIAGTYTPFTLGVLRGPWGWTLLAVVWTFALAGVAMKVFGTRPHPVVSMLLYLAMGWLIVVAAGPLLARMSTSGLVWLSAGGAAYTLGVVFFALDARMRYGHFLWHLFVLAGTTCHVFAVLDAAG